jgi:hypothetical protein
MKAVGLLMVLIGVTLGIGAIMEFFYFGPEASQFWVGVFTTPAAAFFAVAGVVLCLRGLSGRSIVFLSALLMCTATIAATALGAMGPPATLMGMIGSLVVVGWFWRTRNVVA